MNFRSGRCGGKVAVGGVRAHFPPREAVREERGGPMPSATQAWQIQTHQGGDAKLTALFT